MHRLRLIIAAVTLTVALFVGSGVAFAGVEWCDWGCPPPMESGKVDAPREHMPTPIFKNSNEKFIPMLNADSSPKTVNDKPVLLPPGFGGK